MEALVPLMEGASTLDWLTLGALGWLIYRVRGIKADLEKHEDMCVEFRRGVYSRLGALENDTSVLKDRDERDKP